jgi:hypothetical protein
MLYVDHYKTWNIEFNFDPYPYIIAHALHEAQMDFVKKYLKRTWGQLWPFFIRGHFVCWVRIEAPSNLLHAKVFLL